MPEITTCEQYVLNELDNALNEVDELHDFIDEQHNEIVSLKKKIEVLEDELEKYKGLILKTDKTEDTVRELFEEIFEKC